MSDLAMIERGAADSRPVKIGAEPSATTVPMATPVS